MIRPFKNRIYAWLVDFKSKTSIFKSKRRANPTLKNYFGNIPRGFTLTVYSIAIAADSRYIAADSRYITADSRYITADSRYIAAGKVYTHTLAAGRCQARVPGLFPI